ncbi:MAG: pyrroline-5-carboxylate reductase [Thermoguttaceae bacterium]|jgi:pyrroline-5-carboxylate reductase
MLEQRIGLIGAGQMATALASGFIKAGLTAGDRVLASDVDESARQRFGAATAALTTSDNATVIDRSDLIILAVKPQQMEGVAAGLRGKIGTQQLVVSIAAGIRLATLAKWFGQKLRIIRVMPNTPCLIGQGACAYSLGERATPADADLVGRLLAPLGSAWQVEERLLDAVTGLAGSGPAFVYVMIEALGDAGVRMGLPRSLAAQMAAKTVRGAAEMVLTTGEHPAVLKDRVASPGGTTIAGLQALESGSIRGTLMSAVEAAARRSAELGKD